MVDKANQRVIAGAKKVGVEAEALLHPEEFAQAGLRARISEIRKMGLSEESKAKLEASTRARAERPAGRQMFIEEEVARRKAAIDEGRRGVVGLNEVKLGDTLKKNEDEARRATAQLDADLKTLLDSNNQVAKAERDAALKGLDDGLNVLDKEADTALAEIGKHRDALFQKDAEEREAGERAQRALARAGKKVEIPKGGEVPEAVLEVLGGAKAAEREIRTVGTFSGALAGQIQGPGQVAKDQLEIQKAMKEILKGILDSLRGVIPGLIPGGAGD